MIHILLVDDHKMFTEGLTSLLSSESEFKVIGEAQSKNQVATLLQEHTVNVVLLDINLGKESGLDICKYICDEHPSVRVIAISMYSEESFITKMLKNGASGYILKNTGREELLKAIRIVHEGGTYQSAEVMSVIVNGLSRQKQQEKNIYQLRFTRREKEILDLIAKGLTTREIANELFISEKTVETHRSNLLAKFDVKNVVSLLKMAMEYGYVK
ncbi:MAG: response regulator [Spirosomataceae bacterium]